MPFASPTARYTSSVRRSPSFSVSHAALSAASDDDTVIFGEYFSAARSPEQDASTDDAVSTLSTSASIFFINLFSFGGIFIIIITLSYEHMIVKLFRIFSISSDEVRHIPFFPPRVTVCFRGLRRGERVHESAVRWDQRPNIQTDFSQDQAALSDKRAHRPLRAHRRAPYQP